MQNIRIILLFLFLFPGISSFSQTTPVSKKCPCCEVEYRQFDFWLGDWEVSQNGTAAGTSNISMGQDSCLIIENWKSGTSDYKGTSYNFFDNKSKMWYQTWVDNKGGNLKLKGLFENGKMILMDEPKLNNKNQLQINKISWIPNEDETVRQLWELSVDLGNSWTTLFDGLYKPIKK